MDKRVVANEVLLEDAAALMQEGREVTLKPLGSSMLPFIRGGRDSVRLKKMPSVAVGDMLLVRLKGWPEASGDNRGQSPLNKDSARDVVIAPRYVLHRLIQKDGERLTLMGDGNLTGTENCTEADVLGTVTAIERGRRVVVPGNGRWWRVLKPFRRYILGIYRRLFI